MRPPWMLSLWFVVASASTVRLITTSVEIIYVKRGAVGSFAKTTISAPTVRGGTAMPAGAYAAQKLLLRTHLRGLTPSPHPHVNAGRLIPNSALTGIKSSGNCFMKQSRLRLENDARMLSYGVFALWGCSPHAPGNMGCCIPSDALAGIEKVQKTLKNCLESLGTRRRDFAMWGLMPPPRPGSGRATPTVRFAQCQCNYEKKNRRCA